MFSNHVGSSTGVVKRGLHHNTSSVFNALLQRMPGNIEAIDTMIDKNLKDTIVENRKRLVPIVDTIKLCGRLGLPLRGHRSSL